MLLPSTRRLVLLSLLAFCSLVLFWRSPYSRILSYDEFPSQEPIQKPLEGSPDSLAEQPAVWPDNDASRLLGEPAVKPKPKPIPEESPVAAVAPVATSETTAAETSSTSSAQAHVESTPAAEASVTSPADVQLATTSSSTTSSAPAYSYTPPSNIRNEYQKLLDWDRPLHLKSHWPPYQDYVYAEYDPNAWEQFDQNNHYYLNTSNKKVEPAVPKPYSPYPDYNSAAYKKQWKGEFVACESARGLPFNESTDDQVLAYHRSLSDFPIPMSGSFEAIGMDSDVCFDRYGRYGPYGLQDGRKDLPGDANLRSAVHWQDVKWGKLQDECVLRNAERFAPHARNAVNLAPGIARPEDDREIYAKIDEEIRREQNGEHDEVRSNKRSTIPIPHTSSAASSPVAVDGPQYRSRTAVLIRTWEGYQYNDNDIIAFRSMISELSLMSGGEYQVFLFVNVKDKKVPIFDDQNAYDEMMRRIVPRELHDIAILWNENICESWYPKVGDWQVYWQQFMPLQWFSKTHPEFEYIWNWETDARYTGQHYEFLEKIAEYARKAPRKYLWERNARYYLPATAGLSYEQYFNDTNAIIESNPSIKPIWGPAPYDWDMQKPIGPTPPHSHEQDKYEWGVDEEADLITLLPIWDPRNTHWSYTSRIWNFIDGVRPHFTPDNPTHDGFDHPGFPGINRRVFINTVARFSKRQLHAMHVENLAGRSMQAEMWPASVALHHGLKAVAAPQPIWSERKWPPWYADAVFNADGGRPGLWGQQDDSIYNQDREHNFSNWSWYYRSGFPTVLYRRWLGMKSDDAGPQRRGLGEAGGPDWERRELDGGRMCVPGILLHPIKNRDVKE